MTPSLPRSTRAQLKRKRARDHSWSRALDEAAIGFVTSEDVTKNRLAGSDTGCPESVPIIRGPTLGCRCALSQVSAIANHQSAIVNQNNPGDDLLSHKATLAVPSALEDLTSVFGMGTGVAPPV